jgi:hypothetical protein
MTMRISRADIGGSARSSRRDLIAVLAHGFRRGRRPRVLKRSD